MFQNFDQAYKYVQIDEKGKDDDPDDSGGRTCDGITQREYNAWCALHHSPSGDVWNITEDTKRAIYKQQYWLPYCDSMPNGLDYEFFDMAVNMGMHEAIVLLQRTLGVDDDGHYGAITAKAVKDIPNMSMFIDSLSDTRRHFYTNLIASRPKDAKFRRGWMNRVDHAELNAQRIETAAANATAMVQPA